MNITVDLRSLHSREHSGVESYTTHLLERLIDRDQSNAYTLYYNSYQPKRFDRFSFVNSRYLQSRWPSRLLNAAMRILQRPKLESLAGATDVLFMPNWLPVALRRDTKLLLTVHDLSPILMPEMYDLKARLWHRFINLQKLIHRANHILAVSEFTKQSLVERWQIDPANITVTPLGVDHHRYHPNLSVDDLRDVRNRYGLPGEFVLYLGTIEPRKNLLRILEAFEQLSGDASLVIAGKWGWKYQEIVRRINTSLKKRNILVLGYVAEDDKPHLIKLASAFVWPSLYEGFGLPVLEAMAVGTPVITSHVTSIPEVVGDAAIMVDPYHAEYIAEAMHKLLTEPSLHHLYSRKGMERAKRFHWDHTCSATLDALEKLSL